MSTMTTAQLLDRHPLLRRLSGQIIWLMFEEHDIDPDVIQAFLDSMQPVLHGSAEIIEAAMSGEELYARIVTQGERIPCEACSRMVGKAIALGNQGAEALLPPYGLGCPLRAEIIPPGQEPAAGEILAPDAATPHGHLICGEWIFTHPWDEA